MNSFFPFLYSTLVFTFLASLSILIFFQLQNRRSFDSSLESSNMTIQNIIRIVNISMQKQLSFRAFGLLCSFFKDLSLSGSSIISLFFYFAGIFFKDKSLSNLAEYCFTLALSFRSFFKEILFLTKR